jgi:hypothetical protein
MACGLAGTLMCSASTFQSASGATVDAQMVNISNSKAQIT